MPYLTGSIYNGSVVRDMPINAGRHVKALRLHDQIIWPQHRTVVSGLVLFLMDLALASWKFPRGLENLQHTCLPLKYSESGQVPLSDR